MEEYNVTIVGGGIAGLSTALSICKKTDLTLLIVEKSTIGNAKKSPFTFPDIVERFHLSEAVLQKYTRFTYRSPTGVAASFQYEKPAFVTLDYEKACLALLGQIKKKNNIEILENTEAISLENTKTGLKLNLSNHTTVACDALVDASGSSFFIAYKLGLNLPTLYSHPYGEFLEECKIEDPKEMCIFSGNKYGNGGGWLYPIDNKTARFGFATVTRCIVYPKAIVEKNFREAVRNFSPYNRMLAGSKTKRAEFGTIPFGPLDKLVHERILLVGDAAGQATPWYGEGVRPALESGEMCGETLAEAYEGGKLRHEVLEKYQRLWDDKNRELYSRTVNIGFRSYFRNQRQWDNSVRYQASLTPDEMLAIIRYSKWPDRRSNLYSRCWRRIRGLISLPK